MKIAVTFENEQIFQHFGHTEKFKFYEVKDNEVVNTEVIDTNGQGHGALSGFLKDNGADVLICGGIGGGAQTALTTAGIKFFGGVKGACDDAVDAYIKGELEFNPNVKCNNHGEHHHDHNHEHSCGSHNCGSHNCGEHSCH